jgi:hypothetical protein
MANVEITGGGLTERNVQVHGDTVWAWVWTVIVDGQAGVYTQWAVTNDPAKASWMRQQAIEELTAHPSRLEPIASNDGGGDGGTVVASTGDGQAGDGQGGDDGTATTSAGSGAGDGDEGSTVAVAGGDGTDDGNDEGAGGDPSGVSTGSDGSVEGAGGDAGGSGGSGDSGGGDDGSGQGGGDDGEEVSPTGVIFHNPDEDPQ